VNWLLFQNSLLVAGLATLLSCGFGLCAALWLAGLGRPWRGLVLGAGILTLALPPFLVTNSWLHFLGQTGTWRGWLPVNILSLGGTVWILSLLLWPIPMLAGLSAWHRLEPAQLESDMTVTGWPLLRVLLFPLARGPLGQAAVLVFVLALNNFAVPAILQLKVFPAEVWIRFNTSFDSLGALKLSWPMLLAPLILLFWFSRREIPWPHLDTPVSPKLFRQQLGRIWFCCCGAGTLVLCFVSFGLPLLQILTMKRTWTELLGALEAGQDAIWNSLWLAVAAATLVTGLALLMVCRKRRPVAQIFLSAISQVFQPAKASADKNVGDTAGRNACATIIGVALWLPFLVPGVLLGIGLIAVFNHTWSALFYQSAGIVVLAFVIRYLGLGWSTVAHASQIVDPDLWDAARLEGASRWQMLRHVYWPQIAPMVGVAWYIVFLLCLWDVESILLVVPPGGETLALRIFNLLHYGHNAQVNALCLTLLGLAVAPLLAGSIARLALRTVRHRTGGAGFRTSMLVAMGTLAGLLCSCSPRNSRNALQSQLFSHVQIIGTRGVGVGQLNKPRSVAVDRQDNMYVVDMTGRVQKFSPQGQFLLSWQMPQTDLGKPKGMGRDLEGNIIVIEPHYQRLNHFSLEGKLLAQWGQKGTNAGQLIMPRAVAVSSRGEIFVSEYGAVERVQRFRLKGTNAVNPAACEVEFLGGFGHAGTGPGEFNRPEGLCVDAKDRLYVADSCNHRIQVFSSDGHFLRAYGKAGKGLGELSYPYDICVDKAGRQYVCEFGNSRLQIFDANDRPIEIIGGPGAEQGRFANPWGVALDSSGNLYVADSQNHRVQKLIRDTPAIATDEYPSIRPSDFPSSP
jgi:ABC-type Fe3+ transport system permease subunit/DNA-binding beta-propeller fold protein YncE